MVQWHACECQPTFKVAAYAGAFGAVPYRKRIITIDLGESVVPDSPVDATETFVYFSSMEDNVWTEAATLPTGQTVTLTWRPWLKVAPEFDDITRAEPW